MKLVRNCCFLLGVFLLLFQKSLAQQGYNYGRPGLGAAAASGKNLGANIPPTAANALRTIVPVLATGSAATAPGYVTAPTAFGAPGATNAVQGTTAFGGFPAQSQRTLPPTIATNAYGVAGGIGVRPSATPRGGLFGANLGRAQTTQLTGAASTGFGATGNGADADYSGGEGDYSAIPGVPGVDYPIFSEVPQTNFNCAQQPLPGYYSDVEAQCQVFHICALNRTYSFLCPNGTIFSQEVLVCVWWNQYDCASAPTLYENNAFIYDYSKGGDATPTAATNAVIGGGYQVGGISGTARPQTNFPLATSAARTTGQTTAQTAGIFGNSLRPTVTSGGYGGYTTPITPAPRRLSGGRLASPTIARQTFPNAGAIIPATQFGSIDDGIDVGDGGIAIQTNALQTAQLASSPANREYLPPAKRT